VWLLMIVTRPPGAIVTDTGVTRPSVPIVIVAVVGFPVVVGGVVVVVAGGVVVVVVGVGLVGVDDEPPPPPPQAVATAAAAIATARPCHIVFVITKISSSG
jgi:hypothetical protein